MSPHKIQSKTFYQKAFQTRLEINQTQVFGIYISIKDILKETLEILLKAQILSLYVFT